MIVKLLKCQICGERFEAEVLDRENPKEQFPGTPVTCPKCGSPRIEQVRIVRKAG